MRSLKDRKQWQDFFYVVMRSTPIETSFKFWSRELNKTLSPEKKQVIVTLLLIGNRLNYSDKLPCLPQEMWFSQNIEKELGILNYLSLLWIGKYQKPLYLES